jgi:2-polyprenyl-3-methyl-5-hydroxy-6-metoxy-1,4-benzoquinol methylase
MKDYEFQYDEMQQAGADHANPVRANVYDSKMQKFRNFSEEAITIVKSLDITDRHSILDIGAGTGALSIELAKYCKEVTAVDISSQMLDILKKKAEEKNINNIRTVRAGFLTYNNSGKIFDRIISNVVLHHLPDFWKCVALTRIHSMLDDEGLFLLKDVVFSFPIDKYKTEMNAFLSDLEEKTDSDFVKDGILHFKEEFSTFDWLLDKMIEKAGFRIREKNCPTSTLASYILAKE